MSALQQFLGCCGLRSAWLGEVGEERDAMQTAVTRTRREVEMALQMETNARVSMFLQYQWQLEDDEMSADDHASDMQELGLAALRAHEPAWAIRYLTNAIELGYPGHAIWAHRCTAYAELGEYDEAFEDALVCIRLNPLCGLGFARKGEALMGKRLLHAAEAAFLDGLQVAPGLAVLVIGLGQVRHLRMLAAYGNQFHWFPRPFITITCTAEKWCTDAEESARKQGACAHIADGLEIGEKERNATLHAASPPPCSPGAADAPAPRPLAERLAVWTLGTRGGGGSSDESECGRNPESSRRVSPVSVGREEKPCGIESRRRRGFNIADAPNPPSEVLADAPSRHGLPGSSATSSSRSDAVSVSPPESVGCANPFASTGAAALMDMYGADPSDRTNATPDSSHSPHPMFPALAHDQSSPPPSRVVAHGSAVAPESFAQFDGVGNQDWMLAMHPAASSVLDLSDKGLVHLPGTLQFLVSLDTLSVCCNRLHTLPVWLRALSSLRTLNLKGNEVERLPVVLEEMTSLTSLDLGDNYVKSLPAWLSRLCSLKSLDLSRNRLCAVPSDAQVFPSSLVRLLLRDNFLQAIPSCVETMPQLTLLDLLGNPLEDDVPRWLERAQGHNGQLQCLVSIGGLRGAPRKHPLLRELAARVSSTDEFEPGGGIWAQIFPSRHVEEWARASEAASAAPASVGECGARLYCALASTPTTATAATATGTAGGARAPECPHAVSMRTKTASSRSRLETRRLSEAGSGDDDGDFDSLSPKAQILTQYTAAQQDLSAEGVGGTVAHGKELRQMWVAVTCKDVASLDLSHQGLGWLPSSIAHLRALRRLAVDHNRLSSLPDELTALVSLREISCEHNCMEHVPGVLESDAARGLAVLSLADNSITTVPTWASQWVALKTLNLAGNKISDLPLTLRAMTRLQSLNLSRNALELLPLCIGELSKAALHSVDAQGNALRGLPDWMDCPLVCQGISLSQDTGKAQQLASMAWGLRFSCRICQGRGLVNNLDQERLETMDLEHLASMGARREHGPLACCPCCQSLGFRLVPLALASLT